MPRPASEATIPLNNCPASSLGIGLPLSLMVYETCFSFGCCNPAHLGTGTQGEIQALAWRHKNGAPKNRKLAQRAANPQTGAKAYPRFNEEERDLFWGRIDQGRPDVCWPWIGATTGSNGYGVLMRRKRSLRAHRLAYVLVHGPITPVNQVVRHSCDNPPCCNPAHLILGTQLDNAADREARGSQ